MTQDVVVTPQANHKPYTAMVGDKIRGKMAEQHKRQSDLAPLLNITQQSVSKKLNGRSIWDVNELYVVADWLGVDIVELLAVRPAFQAPTQAGSPTTGGTMNARYSGVTPDSPLSEVA